MGYVSLSRAPERRIEARLLGRRAADEDLCRVLHLVGLPRREAEFVTSKLSHPSGADRWRYLRASWTVIFLRRVPLRTGRARLLLTSGKISGAKNDEGLCESRARAGASRRGSPQGTARVRRAPSPRAPSRRRPGLRSRPACVEAPPSIGARAETDVIAVRSRSRGTVF